MSYQIDITSQAEFDIISAIDYIEFVLKNHQAAQKMLDLLDEEINSLTDFPKKCALINDPILSSWEVRFITINNYLAFFTIDEDNKIVIIVRFLYKKSEWSRMLAKTLFETDIKSNS